MATRTLTLTTLCPPEPARREECGRCVRDRLLATAGVRNVSFTPAESDPGAATVRLEYDPRLVPLHELDAELRRAGVCCKSLRASVVLGVDGMISARSEGAIEAALAKLPGVVASANFASRSLRVEFDRTQCALPEIVRRLDGLGLRLRSGASAAAATVDQPGAGYARGEHVEVSARAAPAEKSPQRRESAPAGHSPGAPREGIKSLERLRALILTHHKLAMAAAGAILLLGAVVTRALEGPAALRYALVAAGFVVAGWYTAISTLR